MPARTVAPRTSRRGAAAAALAALASASLAALALAMPSSAVQADEALVIDAKAPPPLTVALPIVPERIPAAVAKLDGLVADIKARTGVPGLAVVAVQNGRIVYAKGFGVRKVGEPAPVDADTVFQLASMSKPVGAGVVAHQVAAGRVSWDTPVVKHLPWFALKDPWVTEHVTIGDFYSHRSGLPDHAGDVFEDLGFDRRQVLERLRFLPLAPFRATYAYTNFGLTAAAEAVATAAGKDWASLAEDVLYKPLGMASTSSRYADFIARSNRAFGHVREGDAFVAKYERQPDAQSPAGGVSSSARDIGRWLAFLIGNGGFEGKTIVPADALLPAMSAQTISSPSAQVAARPGFYGFGFGVSVDPSARVMLSHSGAFMLGAGTNFLVLPSAGIGIAVLTNAQPTGAAEAIAMSFMDLVQFGIVTRDWLPAYQGLFAPLYKPVGTLAGQQPPEKPKAARALAAYAGTYANAAYGDATVSEEAGRLVLTVGPLPLKAELEHWSGDTFVFRPIGENAPPGSISQVAFSGPGPEAVAMTVELLDEDGLGRFSRK